MNPSTLSMCIFRMEWIWPELFSARTLVPLVVNEEQDLTVAQLGGTVNKPMLHTAQSCNTYSLHWKTVIVLSHCDRDAPQSASWMGPAHQGKTLL